MATAGEDPTLKTELGIIQEAFDLINCSYTDQDLQSKQPLVNLFRNVLFSQYDWDFSKVYLTLLEVPISEMEGDSSHSQFAIPRTVYKIISVYNKREGIKLNYEQRSNIIYTDSEYKSIDILCTSLEVTKQGFVVPNRFNEALKLKIASHLAITQVADMQLATWCDNLSLKLIEDSKFMETLQRKDDIEDSQNDTTGGL
jgi:hypothetical protein